MIIVRLIQIVVFGVITYVVAKRTREIVHGDGGRRAKENGAPPNVTISNAPKTPVNVARGGLAVAERLLDGDMVPQGKRRVMCAYCGAENLVPMAGRTAYGCYFCREPLRK